MTDQESVDLMPPADPILPQRLRGGNRICARNLHREALLRIAKLYEIEAEIRGTSAENRQRERQLRTKPLVEAFKTLLDSQALAASRGSPLADAICYALNHWPGLTRFLADGRIEIDSNTVERTIKRERHLATRVFGERRRTRRPTRAEGRSP
jgi:hypothetical protein